MLCNSFRRQCEQQMQERLVTEMERFRTSELAKLKIEQTVELRSVRFSHIITYLAGFSNNIIHTYV